MTHSSRSRSCLISVWLDHQWVVDPFAPKFYSLIQNGISPNLGDGLNFVMCKTLLNQEYQRFFSCSFVLDISEVGCFWVPCIFCSYGNVMVKWLTLPALGLDIFTESLHLFLTLVSGTSWAEWVIYIFVVHKGQCVKKTTKGVSMKVHVKMALELLYDCFLTEHINDSYFLWKKLD